MHTIWPVLAVIGVVAFLLTVALTALKTPEGT